MGVFGVVKIGGQTYQGDGECDLVRHVLEDVADLQRVDDQVRELQAVRKKAQRLKTNKYKNADCQKRN